MQETTKPQDIKGKGVRTEWGKQGWTNRQGPGYPKKFGLSLIVIRSPWGAFG